MLFDDFHGPTVYTVDAGWGGVRFDSRRSGCSGKCPQSEFRGSGRYSQYGKFPSLSPVALLLLLLLNDVFFNLINTLSALVY